MDITEAFETLKLPLDAAEGDVRSAYRALSRKSHPDTPSGKKEAQALLNDARETALAYTKIRGAVVPISPGELSKKIQGALATYNAESARDTARALMRKKTDYLNSVKWFSWIIGAISGALALTINNIEDVALIGSTFVISPEFAREIKGYLIPISLILGTMGLSLQFLIAVTERRFDRFLDSISDKRECAERLAQNLRFKDVESLRTDDIRPEWGISANVHFLPFRIEINYAPILLQKAIEHGLLALAEIDEITPDFRQTYIVKFKPSLFKKPPPAPPAPPKPRTKQEIRSSLVFALSLSGVSGVIFFVLIFFDLYWWALLPALLGVIGSVTTVAEYKALRDLTKKEDPSRLPFPPRR